MEADGNFKKEDLVCGKCSNKMLELGGKTDCA